MTEVAFPFPLLNPLLLLPRPLSLSLTVGMDMGTAEVVQQATSRPLPRELNASMRTVRRVSGVHRANHIAI